GLRGARGGLVGGRGAAVRCTRGAGPGRHGRAATAGAKFNGSADVYAHFRPFATDRVETFHAVLLDNKHYVLRTVEISRRTLTASLVHPREGA
ncbi:MAG: JAB domain-containing protein, partial [Terriglobales bacterium]